MANAITTQVLFESTKRYFVKINILGDGSGEETGTVLVDVSALTPAASKVSLVHLQAAFIGFTAELLWDATTDVRVLTIPEYWIDFNFHHAGGLDNNAGTGVTGDLLITTTGLGSGDSGFLVMEFDKTLA